MLTGWQLIDGKWYYLNPVSDGTKGAMITNSWIDIYYVDENGVWDETKTK
jgi:glucan-binding YG repeat protein